MRNLILALGILAGLTSCSSNKFTKAEVELAEGLCSVNNAELQSLELQEGIVYVICEKGFIMRMGSLEIYSRLAKDFAEMEE